jgi:hypothetical protein
MEESKLTNTENGETDEDQGQEHDHHFFLQQGDCSQRIRSGSPDSQFRILLRCFTATVSKCAKTSPRTLVTKFWLLHTDDALSGTSIFTREFFYQNQHDCRPPPTLLA